MQFVWWLTGVCIIFTACKFVIKVFKRIGSANNMDKMIDKAGDSFDRMAETVADKIKERRELKKEEKRPIVTIR